MFLVFTPCLFRIAVLLSLTAYKSTTVPLQLEYHRALIRSHILPVKLDHRRAAAMTAEVHAGDRH